MNCTPDFIENPAAWHGKAMATQPDLWTRYLTLAEIHELEAAAEALLAKSTDLAKVNATHFPLPEFGQELTKIRKTLQHGIGFQLLKGLPIEHWSIEKIVAIYCGIGAHLGSARSQNAKGHLLGHVKNVGADLSDPNVRVYQTAERQTFHTDSCDCVGLLCLKEAMEGGESLLVSTLTLYNEINARRPDLAKALFEPFARDRRGEVPAGKNPWYMMPVLNWYEDRLTGIYHRTYIDSANRFKDAPLPGAEQTEALDMFDDLANDPAIHLRMHLQPGDIQLVYNHTTMHDRTTFQDWPDPGQARHMLRLWLALIDDRPLPPVFAERYGSIQIGNRGGIVCEDTQKHVPLTP